MIKQMCIRLYRNTNFLSINKTRPRRKKLYLALSSRRMVSFRPYIVCHWAKPGLVFQNSNSCKIGFTKAEGLRKFADLPVRLTLQTEYNDISWWCPYSDLNGDVQKDTGPQPAVYASSTIGACNNKESIPHLGAKSQAWKPTVHNLFAYCDDHPCCLLIGMPWKSRRGASNPAFHRGAVERATALVGLTQSLQTG